MALVKHEQCHQFILVSNISGVKRTTTYELHRMKKKKIIKIKYPGRVTVMDEDLLVLRQRFLDEENI